MTTRTYSWNWATITGTKNDSNRVQQSTSSLTSRALPARGSWDVNQLNSIHSETLNDVIKLFSQWNTIVQPFFKSLPAGGLDSRWGGLRSEIDTLTYGLDGTTMFVFQDASPDSFDGRYWNTNDTRPYTLAEVLEDHEGRIAALEAAGVSASTTSLFDDTDLWDAVGWGLNPNSSTGSASGSLHFTQLSILDNLEKLAKDVYGVSTNDPAWPGYQAIWNGPVFKYGIYEYLAYITDIHNVDMLTGEDPSGASHSSIVAHTHTQSEIVPSSGYTTRNRAYGLPIDLEQDLQRLRYEVEYTRGSTWNNGTIVGPFVTNYPAAGNLEQTLLSHINYTGSGTASTTDPHGLDYTDTGADVIFGYSAQFTGQVGITDVDPAYSSTVYITQGTSLTTAIGTLDASIDTIVSGTVQRLSFSSDRTTTSEQYRWTNPINIFHSMGDKPIVQVYDTSPESEDMYGQYQALTRGVNIVHVDDNNLEVWTSAAEVLIICIG